MLRTNFGAKIRFFFCYTKKTRDKIIVRKWFVPQNFLFCKKKAPNAIKAFGA